MTKRKKDLPEDKLVAQKMKSGASLEIDWSPSTYNWSDPRISYGGSIEGQPSGGVHVPWSSPDYDWADFRITYDGTVISQFFNRNIINVLFSIGQPNNTIHAPQVTRTRVRHRGQRESEKNNLEMYQFLFDIRELYELINFNSSTYYYDAHSIEYGSALTTYSWSSYYPTQIYDDPSSTYNSSDYDGPIFTSTPDNELTPFNIPGSDDIIMHLSRLLTRVKALENSRPVN